MNNGAKAGLEFIIFLVSTLQILGLEVGASISDQYETQLCFFLVIYFWCTLVFSEERLKKHSSADVFRCPYKNFILLMKVFKTMHSCISL